MDARNLPTVIDMSHLFYLSTDCALGLIQHFPNDFCQIRFDNRLVRQRFDAHFKGTRG